MGPSERICPASKSHPFWLTLPGAEISPQDAKTLANAHGLVAGEIEDSYVAMFVEELSQLKGYE
jgi:hypothetical protein